MPEIPPYEHRKNDQPEVEEITANVPEIQAAEPTSAEPLIEDANIEPLENVLIDDVEEPEVVAEPGPSFAPDEETGTIAVDTSAQDEAAPDRPAAAPPTAVREPGSDEVPHAPPRPPSPAHATVVPALRDTSDTPSPPDEAPSQQPPPHKPVPPARDDREDSPIEPPVQDTAPTIPVPETLDPTDEPATDEQPLDTAPASPESPTELTDSEVSSETPQDNNLDTATDDEPEESSETTEPLTFIRSEAEEERRQEFERQFAAMDREDNKNVTVYKIGRDIRDDPDTHDYEEEGLQIAKELKQAADWPHEALIGARQTSKGDIQIDVVLSPPPEADQEQTTASHVIPRKVLSHFGLRALSSLLDIPYRLGDGDPDYPIVDGAPDTSEDPPSQSLFDDLFEVTMQLKAGNLWMSYREGSLSEYGLVWPEGRPTEGRGEAFYPFGE